MALRTWKGDVDGDWNDTGNWLEGSVPTTGDDVVINYGSVNIDENLTTNNSDELASLYIGPEYTGKIGLLDTSPLKFNCTGSVIIDGGGNQHYLSVGDGSWSKCFILGVGPTRNGNVSVMGAITTLVVRRGTARLYSGTTTTCYLDPVGGSPSSCKLNIFNATITTLNKIAAPVVMQEDGAGTITTLNMAGGTLTAHVGHTITTANVYSGTLYSYMTTTMTTANVVNGALWLLSPNASTITTLNLGPGGAAYVNQGGIADTVTTANVFGGTYVTVPAPGPIPVPG